MLKLYRIMTNTGNARYTIMPIVKTGRMNRVLRFLGVRFAGGASGTPSTPGRRRRSAAAPAARAESSVPSTRA